MMFGYFQVQFSYFPMSFGGAKIKCGLRIESEAKTDGPRTFSGVGLAAAARWPAAATGRLAAATSACGYRGILTVFGTLFPIFVYK